MAPPAPLESELEAAHARCEWQVSLEEVERRLGICRECPGFLRHGCPAAPSPRAFVARLVGHGDGCECWRDAD